MYTIKTKRANLVKGFTSIKKTISQVFEHPKTCTILQISATGIICDKLEVSQVFKQLENL
jgi:hypothetical protein